MSEINIQSQHQYHYIGRVRTFCEKAHLVFQDQGQGDGQGQGQSKGQGQSYGQGKGQGSKLQLGGMKQNVRTLPISHQYHLKMSCRFERSLSEGKNGLLLMEQNKNQLAITFCLIKIGASIQNLQTKMQRSNGKFCLLLFLRRRGCNINIFVLQKFRSQKVNKILVSNFHCYMYL